MKQFGSTMYEEAPCFARCEPGFSMDENASASCAAFLGLDECFDRHLMKSSALTPLISEVQNNGDSLIGRSDQLQHHLDFELEDNGQLLHDMIQQQQQQYAPQQQAVSPSAAAPVQQQQSAAVVANWEESIHVLQEMILLQQHQALQCPPMVNDHPSPNFPSTLSFTSTSTPSLSNTTINPKFPGESELLSLLQLPRCASASMPSSMDQSRKLPMTYNPPHPNDPVANYHTSLIDYNDPQVFLHQQPAHPSSLPPNYQVSLKHLFHNIGPQASLLANAPTTSSSSTLLHHVIHVGAEEKEATATFTVADHDHDGRVQFNATPIFDFKRVENAKGEPRGINHFATERQRREYLNEKYQTLRSLVPNPTKADRASIVQDAIEYVKELKRRVQELQMVVQERSRQRLHKKRKLHSSEESRCLQGGTESCTNLAADLDTTSPHARAGEGSCMGILRSSLLQRTSQFGTHVDVRIVEEDVNIKLTRKKRALLNDDTNLPPLPPPRANPLLLDIVVALHDLHLDLLSANGATIGDYHVFMLNTKIMEGSSTYASQVVTKLIEVVDRQVCNNFSSSY